MIQLDESEARDHSACFNGPRTEFENLISS